MKPPNHPPKLWLPLAGSGLELATATIAGLGVGLAAKRWLAPSDWPVVAGLAIGFSLGMTRFVRRAATITRRVAEAQSPSRPIARRETECDDVPQ